MGFLARVATAIFGYDDGVTGETVKDAPLYDAPEPAATHCSCGSELIFCSGCYTSYCARCERSHVGEDSDGETYWACDYFGDVMSRDYIPEDVAPKSWWQLW